MKADRSLLTDAMWAELSPLLPGQAGSRGVTARDTRGFVEAVLWLGRTGVPWRDLPPHLGHWHRVYVRFARWRDAGVWEKATQWLIAHNRKLPHARQRQVQVDSTSVRVHQHGTGAAKKTGNKPLVGAGAGAPASCT
jgi:transposase